MSFDGYHAFLPGPRVEELLPALVHHLGPASYQECPDPAHCAECAPKLARRRVFDTASGEERALLEERLGEAQRLDASEAVVQNRMRAASRPGILF